MRKRQAKAVNDKLSDMTAPVAYTDGACLGNPGPGGWGVRILYPDATVEEYGGVAAASTTNNQMELQAAIEALHIVSGFQSVVVVTDSRYVIDGVTQWIHAWRRRNWMTVSHTPVKNRQLWVTLDQLNHAGVQWRHVRGHSGDPGNERVDDIARGFAQGAEPALFKGQAGDAADPMMVYLQARSSPSLAQAGRKKTPGIGFDKPRYVSIIHGRVALDDEWASCSTRVRGVSGALYKKVRNAEELAAFCTQHGVEALPDV